MAEQAFYARPMRLHPALEPLAYLVGTWRGAGHGEYPSIEPFDYTEELTFTHVGKPFLIYHQRTWSPAGDAMHTECGFLRAPAAGTVEFTIAQPTGQTELAEGCLTVTAPGVDLEMCSQVVNTGTAKHVEHTERTYRLVENQLSVDFAMAAVGYPITHHLASALQRAYDGAD